METSPAPNALSLPWLRALRTYVGCIALGNLVWEVLQLPLYTIWTTGTPSEQAFAVVHCTGGDILIALATVTLAAIFAGELGWPVVAALALAAGIAYTGFSEWHNVYVRKAWAYSEWMPLIRIAGYQIGASPLLQWLVVPSIALWAAGRAWR